MSKGGVNMGEIKKALRDLEKAVESNKAVKTVKITITLQEPKPNKTDKALKTKKTK